MRDTVVEDEHAPNPGQALDEPREWRKVRHRLDLAEPLRHEDHVRSVVADRLEGDVIMADDCVLDLVHLLALKLSCPRHEERVAQWRAFA
jgi:hypothetical protein